MKICGVLFFLLTISACASGGKKEISDLQIVKSKGAINICIDRYARLSGLSFFGEVDRVYIYAVEGQLDLVFTRGELGTFARRSEVYRPFLSCGVQYSNSMDVYFLSEPMKNPLIDVSGVDQIGERSHDESVWELLYVKENGEFTYSSSQLFNPASVDVPSESNLVN